MYYFLDKGIIYGSIWANTASENKVKGKNGLGKSKQEETVFW